MQAEARIDRAALEHNVATLTAALRPGSALCAVVKADGYGHGAELAAPATGTEWLAVATAVEAAGHFDLCRCGIAIYGIDPFHADASSHHTNRATFRLKPESPGPICRTSGEPLEWPEAAILRSAMGRSGRTPL